MTMQIDDVQRTSFQRRMGAGHVGFKTLSIHRGGPGFAYALEIQLEGHHTHNSRYATEAPRTPEFLRELHTGKRF